MVATGRKISRSVVEEIIKMLAREALGRHLRLGRINFIKRRESSGHFEHLVSMFYRLFEKTAEFVVRNNI